VSVTLSELFPDPALEPRGFFCPNENRPKLRSISVVLPAFNEQYNLRRTVEAARRILPGIAGEWEIIVVNDGSHDATARICDSLVTQIPQVRAVHHCGNRGYGAALKSGIMEARNDWIFFSDSDCQFDFAEISRLLEHVDTCDIVAGFRFCRNDPFYRALNAAGWNMLVSLLLGVKVRDIDCAFKLFRRSVFERVQIRSVGAMVNTEILSQAVRLGMRIKEVEVTHYPREHGQPSGARLRVIIKAFRELFRMWWKLRNITHEQEGLYPRAAETASSLRMDSLPG
jgi:glycosyltransferase involved in cell wall biosynthesis